MGTARSQPYPATKRPRTRDSLGSLLSEGCRPILTKRSIRSESARRSSNWWFVEIQTPNLCPTPARIAYIQISFIPRWDSELAAIEPKDGPSTGLRENPNYCNRETCETVGVTDRRRAKADSRGRFVPVGWGVRCAGSDMRKLARGETP